jgi:hypothetical protein
MPSCSELDRHDVIDPQRHFATINWCIAKGSFNHLVGDGQKVEPEHQAERIRFVRLITIRSRRAA